jgi:hypothetical protein
MFYSISSHDMLDTIEQNIYKDKKNNNEEYNEEDKEEYNEEEKELDNECLICLDKYYGENKYKTYSLIELINHGHINLIKNCECNTYVHNECLTQWLSKKMSCIICRRRINIIKIDDTSIENIRQNISFVIYCVDGFYFTLTIVKKIFFISAYTYTIILFTNLLLSLF